VREQVVRFGKLIRGPVSAAPFLDLVINLKTAKALGFSVSATRLAIAEGWFLPRCTCLKMAHSFRHQHPPCTEVIGG
jgi:hypothetical protein